jgi:membrane fusion protein, heavy metal efflux system
VKNRKIAMVATALLIVVVLTALGPKFTGTSLSVAADKHGPKTSVESEKHEDREESSPAKGHAEEGRAIAGKDSHEGESEEEHKDEKVVHLSEADMGKHGIETAVAGAGKLKTHVSLTGEVAINADRMAHIVSPVPGVVREVLKNLGDAVKQGEVMAVVASRALADARAEYLAAREKAVLAQAKYSREERLWKKKISSEEEYLDAKQAHAEALIAQRSAEQKLHALGLTQDRMKSLSLNSNDSFTRLEITAPFTATVIEKHISLGEVLKEDTEAFAIADLSSVWVNFNIYQKDLAGVQKGQSVLITSGRDAHEAEGIITYIGPLVAAETRTALARVVLPNPDGYWRPGMFVTAKVAVEDVSVPLLVPKTALQTVDEKTVVFVRTDEGFEPKPVTVGRTNDAHVEITSGLAPGERYAAKGSFTLKAQLSKGAFGDGHNH